MSGSRTDPPCAEKHPVWVRNAERTKEKVLLKREERKALLLKALSTWTSIQQAAKALGFSETNATVLIRELKEEGKLKTMRKLRTNYYMKF